MSVLVSEVSLNASELNRLLLTPFNEWSLQARIANITQAGSTLTQYTQYQLVVTAVPRNSIDLDARYFTLWTRFKDLSRLWSQLSKIHQQLYLHGTFPTFAPSRLFGSTEPSVVAERIEATSRFFNFVFASEVLRKTSVLHNFLEAAEETPSLRVDPTSPITSSAPITNAPSIGEGELMERPIVVGESTVRREEGQTDKTEEQSVAVPSSNADPHVEVRSISSTSRTSGGNLIPVVTSSQSMASSASCLFDFPDVPVQSSHDPPSAEDTYFEPHSPTLLELGSHSSPSRTNAAGSTSQPQQHSIIGRILPRIFSSSNVSHTSTSDASQTRRESNFYSILGAASLSGGMRQSSSTPGLSVGSHSVTSSPQRTATPNNDYLVQAAQFISTAQKAESESAFELAFHCYKSAVNALIQGVQYERDLPRRNAVRKKTAKYLLKAEKLYRQYLSFDGSAFDVDSWLSNSVHDPNLIAFQSSNATLKSYRVMDILPSATAKHRVLLVKDRTSGTEAMYTMKMLEKCGGVSTKQHKDPPSTIVPMHIPSMVQLHKFFDTDNFIILLLDHVKHGTLWTFLEDYFEECANEMEALMEQEPFENDIRDRDPSKQPTSSPTQASASSQHQQCRSKGSTVEAEQTNSERDESTVGPGHIGDGGTARARLNAYEGRHVHFSVGGEGDEAMDLTDESAFDLLLRKRSKVSLDSTDSTSGVVEPSVEESNASTSAESFDKVLHSTVHSADVHCFTLDEEAPAPVNLYTRSTTSSSNGTHTCGNGEETSLEEVLERVKRRLRKGKRWPRGDKPTESLLVHWMAQLVSAVYLLHSQGIILSDLRPDNLLIDENGDVKLTYFSQWTDVDRRVDDDVITQCYAAPELLSVTQTVGETADSWSMGAIMFELLCGQPLKRLCPHGLHTALTLPIPDYVDISFAARDLLSRLLIVNPSERLCDDDLRAHPFFAECDWRIYDGTSSLTQSGLSTQNTGDAMQDDCAVDCVRMDGEATPSGVVTVAKCVGEPLNPQQLVLIAQREHFSH